MNKLLEAYSGDRARAYDARRSKSKRWKAENRAMEQFLSDLAPSTVLDCPFGTGRWIDLYEAFKMKVTGVDLSQGMLDEASSKLDELSPERRSFYSLERASIFDLVPHGGPVPDLTVCIRFLNWVGFDDVERALNRLTEFGSPAMIVGASVVPANTGLFRSLLYKLSLAAINLRAAGKPKQHVHSEEKLLAAFSKLGWHVAAREEIMRRNARVNYFYRLTRT